MIKLSTRNIIREKVIIFAKMLQMGAKVEYNLDDIKNEAFKLYMNDIKREQLPINTKRRIVKNYVEEDINFFIEEVQKGVLRWV